MPKVSGEENIAGGAAAPPVALPSSNALRWFIGLRLIVVSALFVGMLIIQVNTQLILQLKYLYSLILFSYGISLVYIVMYVKRLPARFQASSQLLGDIGIVTMVVYLTGGVYSPFSFLYLTVIVAAAVLLRGGGLIFAGLSAISYGVLVDLMVLKVLAISPNLAGATVAPPASRVLFQIMIHVAGFVLVAVLVSFLAESLRTTHARLAEETERAKQFVALSEHVVRSVNAGIVAIDSDGVVLQINPAGERILGIERGMDTFGLQFESIMPLAEQSWAQLRARASSQSTVRHEGVLTNTGTRLGLTIGPLEDERGEFVGFIVNFQDLTALEVEIERRRAQDRMAAVGEMAARMAHEIKNPLASISGSSQMLVSALNVDETGRRLLNIIVDESQRLSVILDGFLDYVRPERSTMHTFDLEAHFRDCVDLLGSSQEILENHEIRLEICEDLRIFGDEHLLRQLFWNLTRNALQAMPDGGVLRITGDRQPGSVILRWCDTGKGMTEEIRQRALEPFVTSNAAGTGLGLAVVYSAVQEHGGTIDIYSVPGEGTTVTIDFPVQEQPVE